MINYSENEIKDAFINAKRSSMPVFFKNFISEDSIPNWENFLNNIYDSCKQQTHKDLSLSPTAQEEESLVGNTLIIDKVYFAPQKQDLLPHFKSILSDYLIISKILFPEGVKGGIGFAGPKFSVGHRFVGLHRDPWDAFTIQCEGETKWIISNDNGFKEEFLMSRGDFLFFPQECYHSIDVIGPRCGLIFNFTSEWINNH